MQTVEFDIKYNSASLLSNTDQNQTFYTSLGKTPICVPEPNYVLSTEIHIKRTNRFRHTNRGSYPTYPLDNEAQFGARS